MYDSDEDESSCKLKNPFLQDYNDSLANDEMEDIENDSISLQEHDDDDEEDFTKATKAKKDSSQELWLTKKNLI